MRLPALPGHCTEHRGIWAGPCRMSRSLPLSVPTGASRDSRKETRACLCRVRISMEEGQGGLRKPGGWSKLTQKRGTWARTGEKGTGRWEPGWAGGVGASDSQVSGTVLLPPELWGTQPSLAQNPHAGNIPEDGQEAVGTFCMQFPLWPPGSAPTALPFTTALPRVSPRGSRRVRALAPTAAAITAAVIAATDLGSLHAAHV